MIQPLQTYLTSAAVSCLPVQGLPKTGAVNCQSWIGQELREPYPCLMNFWLLMGSGQEM